MAKSKTLAKSKFFLGRILLFDFAPEDREHQVRTGVKVHKVRSRLGFEVGVAVWMGVVP